MTFEHDLRRSLHRNAADLELTGGGLDAVVGRARQRRHRRNAAVGTVGTVALLAGAITVVATRDDSPPSLAVATAGLGSSGPLQLEWTSSDGGVIDEQQSSVTAPDGTIYALSTEPGSTTATSTGRAETLYRLGPDGRWSSRSSEQMGIRLADLAAGGSQLYGISTSPTAKGAGYAVSLATSSDEGGSWTSTDLPPVEAPSDVVTWRAYTGTKVAASGSTAVAVVSTSFWVSAQQLPGADQIPADQLVTTFTDDGIVLGRIDRSASPPTTAITDTKQAGFSNEGIPVATVTWAQLGVRGPEDLQRTDVYVDRGDGWQPTPTRLDGLGSVDSLTAADGTFVVSGQSSDLAGAGAGAQADFVSDDGEAWDQIDPPVEFGPVVSLGRALVATDRSSSTVQASTDRGASWQAVPVPAGELTGGARFHVTSLTSGPLGLAVAISDDDGSLRGVMMTRDLESWTSFDLDGLSGDGLGLSGLVVGTDRVVVTVLFRTNEGNPANDPSRTRTFIGVPTRVDATSTTTTVAGLLPSASGAAPTTTVTVPPSTSSAPASTAPSTSTTTIPEPSATTTAAGTVLP